MPSILRMKEASVASRLIRVIVLALSVQLLISLPLWIASERTFPTVALFTSFPVQWGNSLDAFFYISLLISCLLLFIEPFNRKAYFFLLSVYLLFLLEDINRLQPWAYLYLMMLSSLLFFDSKDSVHVLTVFRIVLSSVYFWGGLQKINVHFAIEIFPWLADFTEAKSFLSNHHCIAYMAAGIEALSGIFVWIPKLRKTGSLLASLMHLFILVSLGPFVHNWNIIVWPWNLAFAWMDVELFYLSKPTNFKTSNLPLKLHLSFVLIFATIMPAFGMFGKWDNFLSDGFYSAMVDEPAFYFQVSEANLLPVSSRPFQYELKKEHKAILLISYWALDDLKVPLYPEDRVYREVARKLSHFINDKRNTGLRITYKKRMTSRLIGSEYPYDSLNFVK